MKSSLLLLTLFTASLPADDSAPPASVAPANTAKLRVSAKEDEAAGTVAIRIEGHAFAEVDYKKYAKPVISTLIGPTGVNLLRNWPMRGAAPGEETDHPHHKGMWFDHGSVNGVDFWAETEKSGKIVVAGKPKITPTADSVTIETSENWIAPGDKKICSSHTLLTLGLDGEDRFAEYNVTVQASEADLTFGDTKEGSLGLRSHPALNLKGKVATAHAVNSEGEKDLAIWGKKARWVDYTGTIDGKTVGIACFDYPANLRYPTTWHAREYGLIAANPFGLHDFDKKKNPEGAGNHTVKKGDSLTFRYRWLFHKGDTAEAKIEDRWKKWTGK